MVRSISSSFPTVWHYATKFGVNQILIAITLASISGISRTYRITAFSGDGLVKSLLRLDKGINKNAIFTTLKSLGDLLKAGTPQLYRLVYCSACQNNPERHQTELKMYEHHFYKAALEELDKLI